MSRAIDAVEHDRLVTALRCTTTGLIDLSRQYGRSVDTIRKLAVGNHIPANRAADRACSDCGTPISPKSTGRCRSCALANVNRSAAMRARSSDRATSRNTKKGRGRGVNTLWCPDDYVALNRKMTREGFPIEERKRIIAEDLAVRARREAAQ